MVLDTRDIEDSSTIFRFPVSTHKKSDALLKNLVRIFFKPKKIFFLFYPDKGVVGGGVGPKHANIVLGRSQNSSDALN